MQGRGAGDDHEEADDPGEDGAGNDIDPLEAQVLDAEPLVDGVGLDEGEPPRRQRRPDRRDRDQYRVAGERDGGDHGALGGGAPVGVSEEAGDDVGDEDRAQRQQDVLDVAEVPPQDEGRDPGRG